MRKFDTKVQYLKYKVLREVAREAWNDTLLENILDIPRKIVPGKVPTMRCCGMVCGCVGLGACGLMAAPCLVACSHADCPHVLTSACEWARCALRLPVAGGDDLKARKWDALACRVLGFFGWRQSLSRTCRLHVDVP